MTSQQGPEDPQGQQGPQGSPGPQGPTSERTSDPNITFNTTYLETFLLI